jgi:hypothetical protein
VVPNPARAAAEARFVLPAASGARLVAHDLAGRIVARFDLQGKAAGPQRLALSPDRFPAPGIYFLRLDTAAGSAVRRFVVLPQR